MAIFVIYVVWIVLSYNAERGKMPEFLCIVYALAGFLIALPVYVAIGTNIFLYGFDPISTIAFVAVFFLPIAISFLTQFKSGLLFLCYLPWYVVFLVFFLIFVPGYSFARLWDTTWGNRATGNDNAISDTIEYQMRTYTIIINIILVVVNIGLTVALIRIFSLGYGATLACMVFLFIPLFIQYAAAICFFVLVVPFRALYPRPLAPEPVYKDDHLPLMHMGEDNKSLQPE
jgi:hypothetical protein